MFSGSSSFKEECQIISLFHNFGSLHSNTWISHHKLHKIRLLIHRIKESPRFEETHRITQSNHPGTVENRAVLHWASLMNGQSVHTAPCISHQVRDGERAAEVNRGRVLLVHLSYNALFVNWRYVWKWKIATACITCVIMFFLTAKFS